MVKPLLAASEPALAMLPMDVLRTRALELKRRRNAYLIVHNYQRGELQDLADATGDSLALAQAAIRADASVVNAALMRVVRSPLCRACGRMVVGGIL